jgi:hypothetical protein
MDRAAVGVDGDWQASSGAPLIYDVAWLAR